MIEKVNPKHIPEFDLALIDADSLMYSIAWTTMNARMGEKLMMKQIETMIGNTDVSEALVFIKGDDNFRYKVDPEYKATRRQAMDPEVLDRVELLYSYARKNFIESHGGEADDYVSIYAYQAMDEGKCPVICHVDKDLNMIPGWHYNFKKKEFYYISPEESFTFMCRQLLTGDSSDNIPGLKGVGWQVAAKILHNKRLSQMKQAILDQWIAGDRQLKTGEIAREDRYERFLKSANCLILRETIDEMRELTPEEIIRKMSWNVPEADYLFHKDRDISDSIILNSLPIHCYMETKRPARWRHLHPESKDTGPTPLPTDDSTQKTTSDSSIK